MKILTKSYILMLIAATALLLPQKISASCREANRDGRGCDPASSYQYECSSEGTTYCCTVSTSECQSTSDSGGVTTSGTGAGANLFSGNLDTYLEAISPNFATDTNLSTPSGIVSTLLPYILVIAGLILFLMLISGGYTMLTSATNPESAQKGKQQITYAIVGFIIIFSAYWIVQIIEVIFGLTILG